MRRVGVAVIEPDRAARARVSPNGGEGPAEKEKILRRSLKYRGGQGRNGGASGVDSYFAV